MDFRRALSSAHESGEHGPQLVGEPDRSSGAATGLGEILLLRLSATPLWQPADGGAPVVLPPRDAALLAWLAIEGPTSRARLATLLWPESPTESARNALRQRLFQLRKLLGAEVAAGSTLLALADGIAHDLAEADTVLGSDPHDYSAEFAAWLAAQRAQRADRARRRCSEAADAAEQTQDWPAAIEHAERLLALDPLREDAHCRLMRLHYLSGDRTAALLTFRHCERLLQQELGARPSNETLTLWRLIEGAGPAASAAAPALPQAAALRRPPTAVGRAAQHQAALDAWRSGLDVLLLGEPGIGKSRLLDGLAETWPGAITVRARPGDGAVPLALLARLVRKLCERRPGWQRHPACALLQDLLADADAGSGARPSPRPLAPPLLDLLTAAAADSPPLALLVDDWQFADDASVQLLGEMHAAPALGALRWLVASRTGAGESAERRIATLRQSVAWHVLTLSPLAVDEIGALLAALPVPVDAPAALANALARSVGGNPLFLLEALRHMLQTRVPLQAEQVVAPRPVKELVAERLAHLPAEARQLLQVAAVAGGDFSVELAEAVTGHDALALAQGWHALERAGLFGAHGAAHDVHAEVALEQLPVAIGRVLHARVAAWLEARPHEPARVAAHWQAAAQPQLAQPHLLAAARHAWHTARAAETFDFFAQVARWHEASGALDVAFDRWFDCADAMTEIGPPSLTVQCLQAMQSLARSEQQQLRVRMVQAVLRTTRGEVEAGMADLCAMMSEAIALGDVRVESECRFAAAHRASAEARFEEALQQLAAGERLLRDIGDERRAAALAAGLAMVLGLRGQPRLALREQQRMLPLAEQHRDWSTWSVLCSSKALQHVREGDVPAALQAVRAARARAAASSIAPVDTALILRNLVEALRWSGELGQALEVCDEFGARLTQSEFSSVRRAAAALYLDLGRPDLARPLLAMAETTRLRVRERLQLELLQRQVMLSGGTESVSAAPWPAEALTGEDLALAAEWALWSGLLVQSPWPLAEVQALARRCRQAGLLLMLPPLDALLAWRGAASGGAVPDAAAGDAAHADGGIENVDVGHAAVDAGALAPGQHGAMPWTALFIARALAARGRVEDAQCVAHAGGDWIARVAASTLPPHFRDSLLRRHPLLRALRTLGSRAGAAEMTRR